jgi:hypothetical protein
MNVFRTMSFEEVFAYLRREFPEADRDYLYYFLQSNFREPFTINSCYLVAREVEKIMYC